MKEDIDLKESVKVKASNDKISLLAGLIIVSMTPLYFVITKEWRRTSSIGLIIIVGISLLQYLFHYLPATKDKDLFNSGGPSPTIVYNIGAFVAFVFYLPLYSPYLLILPAIIFITVYFKGLLNASIVMANIIAIVVFYTLRNGYPHVPYGYLYPYVFILISICYTILVYRAGYIDSKIRSDLTKANDKIAEEREQLNSLINGINDSVIATDDNGNILFFNSSSLKMFDITDIEIDEPFSKYIRLFDDKSNMIDFFSLLSLDKENQSIKSLHLVNKNNEVINLSIDISRVNSVYNEQDKQGVIFLVRDITKDKSLDEERDEFAAVTSHELRTPIAIAEANLSLAMDKRFIANLDEASRLRLERAHQSIIYLADLINQLAELSNIEKEGIKINYDLVDPAKILNQFKTDFSTNADEKGLEINVVIGEGLGSIYTSKVYLMEILENFLTNAIKYTKKGSITLKAELSREVEGSVVFSVTDTGDGIGSSDKPRIFQKFYRAEDYRTKNTRGTGLGLYLTLKIAKFINGKIWFTSEINKGSTFYIQIPSIKASPDAEDSNAPSVKPA